MPGNRVGEFEGIGSLAEAGKAVLHDPTLNLAVVRAPGIQRMFTDILQTHDPSDLLIEHAYEKVPELVELDEAVAEWWKDSPPTNYTSYPSDGANGITKAFLVETGTGTHLDDTHIGPLTLSIRIDNTRRRRTFLARRIGEPSHTPERGVNQSVIDAYQFSVPRLIALTRQYSKIRQSPGDIVIIPNHPHPALHAVRTGVGASTALVMHYRMQPK